MKKIFNVIFNYRYFKADKNSAKYPIIMLPDGELNYATGKLTHYPERDIKDYDIGKRWVSSKDGYDIIQVYVGYGYFKEILKCKQ